jgi:hypothetical protein
MRKVDRLGWADGICFTSYGARIGIRVNDPETLDSLADVLPPGAKPASSPVVDDLYSLRVGKYSGKMILRPYHLLYAGSWQLSRTMDLGEAMDQLESHLHTRVSMMARRYLFVHAGVVAWKGRAIVLPGRTMAGKTSLVAALVRAGATYYSDEYAVLDSRGRVHPYSKPLSIRGPNGQPPRKQQVEEWGERPGTRPLPVGRIVFTEYREGARWRPRALSPGEAMLAMFENTVLAQYKPDLALSVLCRTTSQATALRGKRGEAGELASQLLWDEG